MTGLVKRKLCFCVGSVADLNAARGFVSVLGIPRKNLVIAFDREADEEATRRFFAGCALRKGWPPRREGVRIRFDTDGRFGFHDGELIFRHDPYKYFFPSSRRHPGNALRKSLGLNGRKAVVASLSTPDEVRELVQVFSRLRLVPRPLLIIGLREAMPFVKQLLRWESFKVVWRTSKAQALSLTGRADVAVVSTQGELFDFLKAADLAIMGHDRNLFEPGILGVPILYFSGPLKMSPETKRLVSLFGLRWRKNRTARRLLSATGGAVRIRPALFAKQIFQALDQPNKMVAGTRRAVRRLHEEVRPLARKRGIRLLEAAQTR